MIEYHRLWLTSIALRETCSTSSPLNRCRTLSESLPGWSDLTGVFLLYCLELPDGHPFLKTYTWLAINRMMIPNLMWCLGGNPKIDAIKMSCWRYMLKKGPPILFGICIYIYIHIFKHSNFTPFTPENWSLDIPFGKKQLLLLLVLGSVILTTIKFTQSTLISIGCDEIH